MSKNYYTNLFDKIVDKENIYKAYEKSMEGDGKYNPEAMIFALDEVYNLNQLKLSLIDGTYEFSGYIRFPVFEPKERIVDAPHFQDKIVQSAVNNVLKQIYNKSFIYDSYACIDDKGTHKCAKRIQKLMKKAKWEYGENTTIIKGDFAKFFYSIDRDILKKIIIKKIRCERTLWLLFLIIDSADIIDLLGLPLGNTLSQICANILLNEFDNYCKRKLSLKYYVRYMDDFFIFTKDKVIAKEILDSITAYAKDSLHLKLNEDKTKTFPVDQGVNAIGYKIYTTHMLLRNESKKKIKRKIKAMPELILKGKLTVKKAEQMINSWKGHAEHGDSYNFIQSLLDRFDFLYMIKKGDKTIIKINVNKF